MKKIVMTLALVAFATSSVSAKWYSDKAAGVKVNIPKKWKVEGDDTTLSAESKDGAAALLLMVLDAENLDAALEKLDEELSKVVTNFKEDGEAEQINLNGMKGVAADGEGDIEGKRAMIGLMVLQSPTGKVVLVLGAVQKSKWKKHKKRITKILQSLKPL